MDTWALVVIVIFLPLMVDAAAQQQLQCFSFVCKIIKAYVFYIVTGHLDMDAKWEHRMGVNSAVH